MEVALRPAHLLNITVAGNLKTRFLDVKGRPDWRLQRGNTHVRRAPGAPQTAPTNNAGVMDARGHAVPAPPANNAILCFNA